MKKTGVHGEFQRGFTLAELLIVIAILALLLTIITPSLYKAVTASYVYDCKGKLNKIYKGASQWASEYSGLLPVLTNGTGDDSILSPFATVRTTDAEEELIRFAEDYQKAYIERIGQTEDMQYGGVARNSPFRCPVSENVYADPVRYSSYELLGFSRFTGGTANFDADGHYTNGYTSPIRTYLKHIASGLVSSSEYGNCPQGRVVLAMDRVYADASDQRNNHDEGANVLYGDGTVDFVPREEMTTPDIRTDGEILTEIGADGVLRPNRSYGWHGGPGSTSFFYPGVAPHGGGPGNTNRIQTINSIDRDAARGIFY